MAGPTVADRAMLAALLPPTWKPTLISWLNSDMPKFDVGGFVVGSGVGTASLMAKSEGVMAGVPFVDAVYEHLGCTVEWLRPEGSYISSEEAKAKLVVAKVRGERRRLLQGERTALNIMSRASGVATETNRCVQLKLKHGWHGAIAGTRKTTPGFSLIEKYSLLVGGGDTHRLDLSNMVMLKDNHIWSTGNITEAVRKARSACGFSTKIEVECTSESDAVEAAEAGAEICMLDNFSPPELMEVSARLKSKYPQLILEASGGITRDTLASFFGPHVDVISQGALTHGYPCLDFSLKVPKPDNFVGQAAGRWKVPDVPKTKARL